MIERDSPLIVTSRRRIVYRKSSWSLHNFEVWSGEILCRVSVVKMDGSVFLWVGTAGQRELGEIAIGMPAQTEGRDALSSSLLGEEVGAAPLARQLALALKQPVYICCGGNFDRFTLPLVVRGLINEIKGRPECF